MTNSMYFLGAAKFLDGTIDWDADDIKVALIDEADYTVDLLTDEFLDDIPSGAIVGTSANLTGLSVIGTQAFADDAAASGVTGDTVEAVVVYKDTGSSASSPLITYLTLGSALTPDGGNVTVVWPDGVVFEIGSATTNGYTTLNEAILAADPIGYWLLDDPDTFVDLGSGGNNGTKIGTLVAGANLDASDPTVPSVDFDNAGMVSTALTGFSALTEFSVECIAHFDSHTNGDAIWGITTAPGGLFVGPTLAAGPSVRFDIYNNEITGNTVFPSSALLDGPCHLTFVCTLAEARGYVNGGLVWTGTVADFGDIQGTFCIGGSLNGGGTLLPDARISNVAVYDYALSADVVAAHGALAVHGGIAEPASVASGEVETRVFSHTGAAQAWTVPDGVQELHIAMAGAGGGHGTNGSFGGAGVTLQGLLAVTPGETLNLYVGGEGETAVPAVSQSLGGFNGGGDGGDAANTPASGNGGGGGGATDIRQGGTALTDRVVVAGGGGGGGGNAATGLGAGGSAGITTGTAGTTQGTQNGGGGGTQSAGGAAGTGDSSGAAGALGDGGDGGQVLRGGGGGGGGYYGGGGGAGGNTGEQGAGGGGGSSLVPGGWRAAETQNNGDGWIVVSYDRGAHPATGPDEDAGAAGYGASSGTDFLTVTSGAAAKGSWVEVISALPDDVNELVVSAFIDTGNGVRLDVGIGAAASETVLVPDLHYTGRSAPHVDSWRIPVAIPAGTRVAVRAMSNVSVTTYVSVLAVSGSETPSFTGVDVMGVDTYYGTELTVPGSVNTKGSWIEFENSSAHEYTGLMLITSNNGVFGNDSTDRWRVDVGVGAASSEVVLFSDLYFAAEATYDKVWPNNYGVLPCRIPAGERIAARVQSVTTGQKLSGVLLGCWKIEDQ